MYVAPDRAKNIIPFDVEGIDARLVSRALADDHGIATRAGSFCTYQFIRKLKNVSSEQDRGIAHEVERGVTRNVPSIARASFAMYNSFDDAERFACALRDVVGRGHEHYERRYEQDPTTGQWSLR